MLMVRVEDIVNCIFKKYDVSLGIIQREFLNSVKRGTRVDLLKNKGYDFSSEVEGFLKYFVKKYEDKKRQNKNPFR